MAANKFATMLHKNTNKITLILIYAVLEWTLIVLLLLNSLFSYLIIKFAEYFGLKPPCLWCSRIDHFFESEKNRNLHRDLLCEVHSKEISKLGYCSNHQKLLVYQDMCEDCSSSRPDFRGVSKNLVFFPWVKQIGMIQSDGEKVGENGEVGLKCACCGVSLENRILSPYIVINPSWGDLEYTQKGNLITEAGDYDHIEGDNSDRGRSVEDEHGFEIKSESQMISDVNGGFGVREEETEEDCSVSVSKFGLKELENDEEDKVDVVLEAEKEDNKENISNMIMGDPTSDKNMIQICIREDESLEILPQHLEFFVDCSGQLLVPVELINSPTEENQNSDRVDKNQENSDHKEDSLGSELHVEVRLESDVENRLSAGERMELLSVHENTEEAKFAVFESMEMEENDNSLIFHVKECDSVMKIYEQVAMPRATEIPSKDIDEIQEIAAEEGEEKDSDIPTVCEEVSPMPFNEIEADVSIGTQIPDLDPGDEIEAQGTFSSYAFIHEDPSTSSASFYRDDDHGSEKAKEETVELMTLSVEVSEHVINNQSSMCSKINQKEEEKLLDAHNSIEVSEHVINNQLSMCSELNEIEEAKIPDTPTSIESFNNLHKKLQLLERKEWGTEDSLDGSVTSEFEGGDGVTTVERLQSALKSEQKALHALYAELEEERSASAVAASQTMAMINRLQEEKAAMQMEALQYQRMMEEQSEYDQEALQLLNELMVKREREKQEVEKDLEIYRKKVLDYEAKEKMRMLRRSKDSSARSGTSSASCSNAEDSDAISIELNQEAKEEDGFYNHQESVNHSTPIDAVLNLEYSLADFEEERQSILEQLKVLEEKLFTLSDEEEQYEHDIRPIKHFYEENGKHLNGNYDFDAVEVNGLTNGFSKEMNGKHHQERRIMGSKAKRLLPLFDAISAEKETGVLNGRENGVCTNKLQKSAITRIELENKRVGVEEEVDQLYERLQALEADREFLKHCISSLKKGDKGMDLLQEILQHLRDLKNVELRAKNLGDCALV